VTYFYPNQDNYYQSDNAYNMMAIFHPSKYFLSQNRYHHTSHLEPIYYPPSLQDHDLLANGKRYLQIMQGESLFSPYTPQG